MNIAQSSQMGSFVIKKSEVPNLLKTEFWGFFFFKKEVVKVVLHSGIKMPCILSFK